MRKYILMNAADCGLWTPAFQSTLTKAARIARHGGYEKAARLLESEVYNYRDSFMFFYLLGLCCLYSGDHGGAHDYLTRAREIKNREPSVLLALAALYMKRSDSRRAISFYLEAQEIDGKNHTVKKALKILRKYADSDDLRAWVESGKIRSLYPPFPHEKITPVKVIRNIIVPCVIIAVLTIFVSAKTGIFFKGAVNPAREGFNEIVLTKNDKEKITQMDGVHNFILTEKQILMTYKNALKFFNDRRDNAARIAINRILESNAGEGIKNKARIMARYLEAPGFETLKSKPSDNIKYTDVEKSPLLYNGCYALWSGRATNIIEGQNETLFDFAISYDNLRTMEGIVKIKLPFAANINPERQLEVLGRIAVDASQAVSMDGITIHQLAVTEN
jgi:tetratricopeptide (TPR) repeat protein